MTITYTVLDVCRNEIIGSIEAESQAAACIAARETFNGLKWDDRFPFEAEVGRELAIRPHYDSDPHFADRDAKPMVHARPVENMIAESARNNGYDTAIENGEAEHRATYWALQSVESSAEAVKAELGIARYDELPYRSEEVERLIKM